MEQFKSALEAFLRESCAMLVGEPPQQRAWVRIIREDGGRTSFPAELRNDFSESLLRFRMRVLNNKMASFDLVVEAVRKESKLRDALLVDAGGKPITDEKAEVWWLENMLVSPLLYAYISRANGFQFDKRIFDELFDIFQKDIFSPDITVTELSPLMNVEMESDHLQIDDNVRLRQLSTSELEEWFNAETLLSPQPLPTYELLELKSAAEIVYPQKRHSAFGSGEAREKLSRLLTAMRLLTDASPRLAFTKTRTSSFLTSGFGTSWAPSVIRHGPLAKIEKSKEPGLVELYKRLITNPNLTGIGLALARWNTAVERLTEEDKLIDYWIALESLFVPDTTQELSYRTALRIASFLGSNGIERKQIYEQVRESYNLRSEIVHGSIRKRKRKLASPELINITRSLLRQSLLKILESSHRFDPSKFELQLLSKE